MLSNDNMEGKNLEKKSDLFWNDFPRELNNKTMTLDFAHTTHKITTKMSTNDI